LGENFSQQPVEFQNARNELGDKILHFGFVNEFAQYAEWLFTADIIPVTSNQDFFSAAAVSAIYCGCYPILPNRLAFPEIFPIERYPENFYHHFEELVEKLAGAITNIEFVRQKNYSSVVEKYSWHAMAPKYDSTFEKMMI
jgi:glycosyltransferase involved in cell wall biosynthesis